MLLMNADHTTQLLNDEHIHVQVNAEHVEYHPLINGLPCDQDGSFLPENAAPPPWGHLPHNDFSPYADCQQFEIADLLFWQTQMAANNINDLMQVWAARHQDQGPPFHSKEHLHEIIDSTVLGDVPCESFSVYYNGLSEEGDVEAAPWKVKG
ncbi:hypothetical protein C0989_012375 [Termitomyces sp. Mn162]|nr:hypothetical protein C0989_012375 [Termitomyces sp. Mn162]